MVKREKLILKITIILFLGLLMIPIASVIYSSIVRNAGKLNGLPCTSSFKQGNIVIISDGYNNVSWNTQSSEGPAIAIDTNQVVHAVWNDGTPGVWGSDYEIMYVNYSSTLGWSNATVISDGYNGVYWNNGYSDNPAIAVDSQNQVHVVWQDHTDGIWGTDLEIFHVKYDSLTGWSNITVISDGYNGSYWNDANSYDPVIAADNEGNVHVVWGDYTEGVWGSDAEIMHVSYNQVLGWSNATVISDGFMGSYWNEADSWIADIAIDSNNNIHVVWDDETDGVWGTDREILYAKYTSSSGWTNATVISDGYGGIYWNDGISTAATITTKDDNVYVAWEDITEGIWGTDYEIMLVTYNLATGWSNISIVSDGYEGYYWNNQDSRNSDIIVDHNNVVHVIWEDLTYGFWGTDTEIMYANFTTSKGWTNITVISDDYAGGFWNNMASRYAALCYGSEAVYIVWQDDTDGIWGTDSEIMFTSFSIPPYVPPTTPAIPFGHLFFLISVITVIGIATFQRHRFSNSSNA